MKGPCLTTKRVAGIVACLAIPGLAMPCSAFDESVTIWTTGRALMPGWGLYPNGTRYGGSEVLGKQAAWGTGNLTWFASIPLEATWQVWVRHYGGYGGVAVAIDERDVTGGSGGSGGARYVWRHLGEMLITPGNHHVDIDVDGTMFDVVLLTTSRDFRAQNESELPEPVTEPILRAPRSYRDDSALTAEADSRGFIGAPVNTYDEHLNDFVPARDGLLGTVKLWGAANQYVHTTFAVRALRDIEELNVALKELSGPGNTTLTAHRLDLRIVHLRTRMRFLFEGAARPGLCPDLLLRDDRTQLPPTGQQGGFGGGVCITAIPAHQSRQVWLTVHVPTQSPPGIYRGKLELQVSGNRLRRLSLPVELEVMPVELKPVEGWYGIYYPSQPVDPERTKYVSPARYVAELTDQVRHGLNGVTLYGGFRTLKYARRGGMTQPPVLMHWPDGHAARQVADAAKRGFPDLYYYGVDEPQGDAIERCRQEAERRVKVGQHMFTAINSVEAQKSTREFIDRPVYNIYVFDASSDAAAYARKKGFIPISYWVTSGSFPLYYRALSGLYNTACGYAGTAPWAYADTPGPDIYKHDGHRHAVSYPDESGRPIPSLRWEALRDGIDDVRYLQALDRAIAAAEVRLREPAPSQRLAEALAQARRVRDKHFGSIGGRWFQYLNSLQPTTLDNTRRALAEATVAISRGQSAR